jgi:hypothetical protein
VTTPDTAAVRAWARENGYQISDRGRIPAEVTEAYSAAHASGKAAAKKAPAKKTPAKKAAKAPAKKAAATKAPVKTVAAPAEAAEVPTPTEQAPGSAPVTDPSKEQSGAPEDRRLIALAEQISALADRVTALEQAQGSSTGKAGRVGRRKSR